MAVIDQLVYGWSEVGLEGRNRFQVIATSPGLSNLGSSAVTALRPLFTYPTQASSDPRSPESDPVSFGWLPLPGGLSAVFHRRNLGLDPWGRPGNYRCRALVGSSDVLTGSVAAQLWRSLFWDTTWGDGTELPLLDLAEIPHGDAPTPTSSQRLHALTTAALTVLHDGKTCAVHLPHGALGDALRELAGVLPRRLTDSIPFSTLEAAADTHRFRLVGVRSEQDAYSTAFRVGADDNVKPDPSPSMTQAAGVLISTDPEARRDVEAADRLASSESDYVGALVAALATLAALNAADTSPDPDVLIRALGSNELVRHVVTKATGPLRMTALVVSQGSLAAIERLVDATRGIEQQGRVDMLLGQSVAVRFGSADLESVVLRLLLRSTDEFAAGLLRSLLDAGRLHDTPTTRSAVLLAERHQSLAISADVVTAASTNSWDVLVGLVRCRDISVDARVNFLLTGMERAPENEFAVQWPLVDPTVRDRAIARAIASPALEDKLRLVALRSLDVRDGTAVIERMYQDSPDRGTRAECLAALSRRVPATDRFRWIDQHFSRGLRSLDPPLALEQSIIECLAGVVEDVWVDPERHLVFPGNTGIVLDLLQGSSGEGRYWYRLLGHRSPIEMQGIANIASEASLLGLGESRLALCRCAMDRCASSSLRNIGPYDALTAAWRSLGLSAADFYLDLVITGRRHALRRGARFALVGVGYLLQHEHITLPKSGLGGLLRRERENERAYTLLRELLTGMSPSERADLEGDFERLGWQPHFAALSRFGNWRTGKNDN